MRRCFPGELRPATSSCASDRGSCRADPEGSVGGRARAGPPPSLCASRDALEWAWAGRPAAGKPPEHPRRAAPQAESPGAGRERPALPPARPSPAALAPPPSSPRVGKFLESLPSGLCGSNMAELTVEVRGSNGAFYKVRAAGRPGRELGIGSGGRGRRGPRGPRRGGGRRRGTAGPRCWRLHSARFNGLGGPGSVMFGNKAAGAGSACCPGAPRAEASGTRAAGREARGWGAGAPAEAWPGGGRRRRRAAHWDPGATGPAGLLSASPAASWGTRGSSRCRAVPGPCEPMASAGRAGERRAGVLAAWGAGGPSAGEKGGL